MADGEERPHQVPADVKYPRLKAWRDRTADEKQELWDKKRQHKKERQKATREEVRTTQKKEWETLTEEQRAEIKAASAAKYEQARTANDAQHQLCVQRLSDPTTPRIVFDLQFESVMNTKGVNSTVAQIKYSYACLRKTAFPLRPLAVVPPTATESALVRDLNQFDGFKKYGFEIRSGLLSTALAGDTVVYLTADSDEVLWDLQPGYAYVVGAFVDHNAKKGLTKQFADEHKLRTARLPLQETIDCKTICRVLTINHVVQCLVEYSQSRSWAQAFAASLPTSRGDAAVDSGEKTPRDDAS
jgi:tRNA (guanine9-N1)-methyltransferase